MAVCEARGLSKGLAGLGAHGPSRERVFFNATPAPAAGLCELQLARARECPAAGQLCHGLPLPTGIAQREELLHIGRLQLVRLKRPWHFFSTYRCLAEVQLSASASGRVAIAIALAIAIAIAIAIAAAR